MRISWGSEIPLDLSFYSILISSENTQTERYDGEMRKRNKNISKRRKTSHSTFYCFEGEQTLFLAHNPVAIDNANMMNSKKVVKIDLSPQFHPTTSHISSKINS